MDHQKPGISRGQSAVIAAISLLLIAIIAPIAIFGLLGEIYDPLDANTTFQNITSNPDNLRILIALLLIIVILEVIVPWALYEFFRPVNSKLSLLTAWFRLMYTAIFAAAVIQLLKALYWIPSGKAISGGMEQPLNQMQVAIQSFYDAWNLSLGVFSIHLFLLGILAIQGGYMKKILGVLLLIAGAGYLIDSFGKILIVDYSIEIAAFTFLGEVVLIFWLLIKGRKL
jgi:hypothetical protein